MNFPLYSNKKPTAKKKTKKLTLGKVITVTPGRRHAWYETSIGPVRKPVTVRYDAELGRDIVLLK